MEIKDKIKKIKDNAEYKVSITKEIKQIEEIRTTFLGKKGEITKILKGLKNLPKEKRPSIGRIANETQNEIKKKINKREILLKKDLVNKKIKKEKIDVTLPGKKFKIGNKHILQQLQDQIEDHFISQGYEVVYGNEIESDEFNFERLNLPKNHPARDMQDTFYITPKLLLRTQTSAMQPRTMDKHDFSKGPLKMISPGKVYRRDNDDPTHSQQFYQIEGLVIGKHITLSDLKGTLQSMTNDIFGKGHAMRFRQSYFPFTEPSVEVDISWNLINSKTSSVEWEEVLGGGIVHPNVLKMSHIDPEKYSGFAFGLGPDRFAMIKYGIKDIRNFYNGDLRFIKQFKQVGE